MNKPNKQFFLAFSILFVVVIGSYVNANLTSDLISYWNFDSDASDILNTHNGTVSGATNVACKINNCYSFDGVNDYIYFNDNIITDFPFSVSFWLYLPELPSAGTQKYLLGTSDSQSIPYYGLWVTIFDESISINVGDGQGDGPNHRRTLEANHSFSTNTWYHVVFSMSNSTTGYIYINNVAKNITSSGTASSINWTGGERKFEFGRKYYPSSYNYVNMRLDEVGIWDNILSTQNISTLYNSGAGLSYPFSTDMLINPADFLSPYKEYSWILIYRDSEYTVTDDYTYDFGYNQTNEFDGNETTLLTDQTINITDTYQSFDINYMLDNSDINPDLYSFITIYKNEVELETLWASSTFDILWDVNLDISNPDYPYIITTQTAETTMTSASSTSGSYGYRILANIDTYIYTITKHSSATPTRAIIKTDAGEIIATASFVGNVATFEDPISLAEGTYYRIEADKEGSSYTYRRQNSTGGFPYANSEINFTGGSYNGGDTSYPYNITAITTGQTENKLDKLIPDNNYPWVFNFSNAGNNANLSYEYTIGLNDTNSFNGSEVVKDENISFSYTGSNQDANMFLNVLDNGNKYAFITVKTYYSGTEVNSISAWTDHTRYIDKYLDTTIYPILTNGNDIIALNDYNHTFEWISEGYPVGHYLKYDWGITDDANILSGTTHVYDADVLLVGYDPEITEYTLEEYIIFDYVGTNWSVYLTYYVYDSDDNLIDSNTVYSGETYDIIFPYVAITIYDSDGLAGAGIKIKDITNNIEYVTDANSQFISDLHSLNWDNKYIQTTITHTDVTYEIGKLEYYWSANYTYDMNFYLYPISDVRTHQFIVRAPDNTLWTNKYIGFLLPGENDDVVGIVKTNALGVAEVNIEPDALLDAVLYDELGVAEYTYENTIVTVKKPKDEITLADISPYDLYIGGLLNYNLINQTDANITFSIFAGVTDYYSVKVADYNATIADRKYVPRNYLVKVEMGSDYSEIYIIQPYLVSTTDAIIPTIKIVDLLGRAVPNAVVVISKYLGDSPEKKIIYSEKTDSTGTLSWSAQPLDKYYIDVYYQDVLMGSYIITPRTSADIYWISIDITDAVFDPATIMFVLDWRFSKEHLIQNEDSIYVDAVVRSNIINGYNKIKIIAKQGATVKSEDVISVANAPLNYLLTYTFDDGVFDTQIPNITYIIELYNNDSLIKSFSMKVTWSKRVMTSGFFGAFSQLPTDLGQPLAAIIAIIMIILLVAVLTMSGLPTNPITITAIGLFGIGFFMTFGYFNTGVSIYGTDVCWVAFVLFCIMTGYLSYREVSR